MGRYIITNEFYCDYTKLIIVGGTKKIEKHNIVPRILIRRTGDSLCCTLLQEKALTESTLYSCSILDSEKLQIKYMLAILNSKFYTYIVRQKMITNEQAFPQILMTDFEELKLPIIDIEKQQPFVEKAETMLQKNKELQTIKSNVVKLLQSQYSGININTKLGNWNELTFKDFSKELEKQKIKTSISEKAELMQYFEAEQTKANSIQQTITQTDKEIDTMVYKLYELSDEEVAIVETEN